MVFRDRVARVSRSLAGCGVMVYRPGRATLGNVARGSSSGGWRVWSTWPPARGNVCGVDMSVLDTRIGGFQGDGSADAVPSGDDTAAMGLSAVEPSVSVYENKLHELRASLAGVAG